MNFGADQDEGTDQDIVSDFHLHCEINLFFYELCLKVDEKMMTDCHRSNYFNWVILGGTLSIFLSTWFCITPCRRFI